MSVGSLVFCSNKRKSISEEAPQKASPLSLPLDRIILSPPILFLHYFFRMIDARTYICLYVASIYLLIGIKQQVNGNLVNLTVVENAVAKGAVCLDGSPPAYHIDKGFGTGINNWLLYIEGGGWCHNVTTCIDRRDTRSGSSKQMAKQMPFPGVLSNQAKFNPDFHNWNRVKVRYCDGSSFTGDVEAVDPANNLHFRGGRVWLAVMEDLLAKGMRTAENVLLSGGSAGGLATIINCDSFRTLLPMGTKVKCFADAAYFLNAKDVSGALYMQSYYDNVVTTHGSAKHLPASCTSRMKPSLCFFPQYIVNEIQTPLFILNPAYDSWQVRNILAPREADPRGTWNSCKFDITKCSADQLNILHNYRLELLNVLPGPGNPTRGMFINSCFVHCQAEIQETWLREDSPVLKNISIAKAVGDWYYDRSSFHEIDCPYPCDTSCHNNISILTNQARA